MNKKNDFTKMIKDDSKKQMKKFEKQRHDEVGKKHLQLLGKLSKG